MDRIGEIFREARIAQGVTLEQVEEKTMVKKRYLEAIENEEWSKLPGKVYAKGFLRSYARFLKLEEQPIIDLFDLHVKSEPSLIPAKQSTKEPGRRKNIELNRRPKTGMILVFCLIALVLFMGVRWFLDGPEGNLPQPPEVMEPAGPGTVTPEVPEEPIEPNEEPVEPRNDMDLVIMAQEAPCWLRLVHNGELLYEGTLSPGEKLEFTKLERVTMTAGNAGAIEITINENVIDALGDFGQVVTRSIQVVEDEIVITE